MASPADSSHPLVVPSDEHATGTSARGHSLGAARVARGAGEAGSAARRILRSFAFAFAGLRALLRTQPNAWVHVALAALALALSFWLGLSPVEVGLVILTIGLVLAAEAINTAVEAVCDLVSPGYHPLVKRAKDVSAAGVLLAAMAAVGVAIALFVPRLLRGL